MKQINVIKERELYNKYGRIIEELFRRIRNEGGQGCKVTMKKDGTVFKIYRLGYSSYENLARDSFGIAIQNDEGVWEQVETYSCMALAAEYLAEY